jgi:hypothetical protein
MAGPVAEVCILKTIDLPKRVWLVGVAMIAAAILVGGCGDDEENPTDEGGATAPIAIETIIASPKAGSPGDTLLLSVIVTSDEPNEGDIPVVAWTASGGAFLEDDQSSVRWIAGDNGIYQVTARATNSINSVSSVANVFVGETVTVVSDHGGAIQLEPNGTDFYYSKTATTPSNGAEVFHVIGGGLPTDAVITPPNRNGSTNHGIAYAPDLSFEVHSVDSINAAAENLAKHVYMGDFGTQTYTKISNAPPQGEKYPVFTDPDVAPDSRYIAFAGMIPSTAPTIADSFDIFIYDTQDQARRRITMSHTNHRNTFPTWSTNQRWLTYISDRSARNVFDLYGSPATGGVVDDAQASVVRLSNTGGTLVAGNPGDQPKPVMTWNPVSPVLAIVGGEALYFVTTTQSGATQIEVPISTAPVEMKWSPDGSLLAASTGATVMTIAIDGTSTPRVTRSGDTFADLAWSADGAWLLYRATRGGSSWLEAYDLDQSQLQAPIPITGAAPHTLGARSLGEYRLTMSMSPAAGTTLLFYPEFTGSPTVGIKSLDISGLSP